MLEEGNREELSQLTYPFGRGVNISFWHQGCSSTLSESNRV